jgi:hypothetical protein
MATKTMIQHSRVIEPLTIYIGSGAYLFLQFIGIDKLQLADTAISILVGVAVLAYTCLKVYQLFNELFIDADRE